MPPKSKKPAGQLPAPAPVPDFDIDLAAALPPGPPPKKGRGRPRSAAPPPPRKYKVRKDKGVKRKPEPIPTPAPEAPIYINMGDIGIDSNREGGEGEQSAVTNLKEKLTVKELKFIEIYLGGGITIDNAMIQAGYGDYSQVWRYQLARKIVIRHETQAQDHRIICRAMGAGEVFIIKTLYSLAKDSKSEKIKMEATMNLAKILGLTKDQIEGAGGITIIFEQPDAPGQPAALALPSQEAPAKPATYAQPVRVLQITR